MLSSRGLEGDSVALIPLPYQRNSAALFQALRHLPYAAWLDGGQGFEEGRYDILCAGPRSVLRTVGGTTAIQTENGQLESKDNPFDLVESALGKLPPVTARDLPFSGGALGYFGYHLNQHLERLPPRPNPDTGLPDMQVGIYHWAVIVDHREKQTVAVFLPTVSESERRRILALVRVEQRKLVYNSFKISQLYAECEEESYHQKIRAVQEYILNGDVYQVNLSQRFVADYSGDPFTAYCHLRGLLPAPYAAYLSTETGAILSHSPELFLQVGGGEVETQPIKGTRPRGIDASSDQKMINELLTSAKDRAENLMIVDLLRNDLGRHCIPGSIEVQSLFELRTFENVHHLVSTVTGTLRQTSRAVDLLRDCFPGGSITGAPKIRAMEIINELEQQERSVYCGSIGYLSTNGNMTTNIAIRTLVANQDRIFAWGGGGIVADSEAAAEYQECLDKIGILLKGLAGT